MEEKETIIEQNPVSQEEFESKIHEVAEANKLKLFEDFFKGILHLRDFTGVSKFKSIRRAIKRGHASIFGDIYPKRPFNNRKRNKENDVTYLRRRWYERITHKQGKVC